MQRGMHAHVCKFVHIMTLCIVQMLRHTVMHCKSGKWGQWQLSTSNSGTCLSLCVRLSVYTDEEHNRCSQLHVYLCVQMMAIHGRIAVCLCVFLPAWPL